MNGKAIALPDAAPRVPRQQDGAGDQRPVDNHAKPKYADNAVGECCGEGDDGPARGAKALRDEREPYAQRKRWAGQQATAG